MLTRESQNAPQLVVASSTTTNAPPAPGNVVATGASSKTVHVTWNDVATNETGYQVQYRLQGSPGAYTS
ncbi:MAG: fibronectin type III domain-containing protein, partial [Tepidisphaeraceae bacterium]